MSVKLKVKRNINAKKIYIYAKEIQNKMFQTWYFY